MKIIAFFLVTSFIIAFLVEVTSEGTPRTDSTAASTKASKLTVEETAQLHALRDIALHNIGWAAGNTYTHSIWSELEGYIGERGEYYTGLVRIGDSDSDYFSNKRTYDEAFERGREHPPDIRQANMLAAETVDLINQMGTLMKEARSRLAREERSAKPSPISTAKPKPPVQATKTMYQCEVNGQSVVQNFPCGE